MLDLDIRPLEPSDARAVREIISQPEVAGPLGGTPLDLFHTFEESFRASFDQPWTERLGAFDLDRGTLAGFVELTRGSRVRTHHAARVTLAVLPSMQRRGIGGALLGAALEAADRWLHLVRLEVEIVAGSAETLRFFERHGFAIEVRRRAALIVDGARGSSRADTLALGRIRPGFTQQDDALRPMPTPPPRRPTPAAMIVRPITAADIPALPRFSRDPTVLFGSSQTPTMGIEAWRRRVEGAPATWSAVVEVGGEVAATGSVHGSESPRRRHAVWIGLSVAGPFQGMGIGDRLTKVLIDTAEAWLGAERVELQVYVDNSRAVRLYEKHGFEREGVLRYDVWRDGGYASSLVMSRLAAARAPVVGCARA